jgi:hypothetical protein
MNEQLTPKEKAKELSIKFDKEGETDNAIKCALIAVDEILIIQEYWGGINNTNYEYWQKVKQEIINYQE